MTVTWVASTGATAYKIFRSGSVSAIGTVGAVTTFNDTSATVGVLYTYTVKAVVGTLGMSAASSGDTGYRNRPAPANVNATDTDTTKVRVTWSAVTGSTGYEVFRSIGGATATLIASPTALLFNDTAIARGTTRCPPATRCARSGRSRLIRPHRAGKTAASGVRQPDEAGTAKGSGREWGAGSWCAGRVE